ncbi:tetratricopeptide repeat protein [Massilia endophytica]|uniref:tetratricopeptide repeat protein n=1 Tax=Massilia endophytica TaxID=2899220 RepID=UPI001E55FB75|nr:tetratricopeptide repeat protein [Massilia endophytica]UGQ45734.1 tetratricopeptide repeat protein [Massilia endophytica]
MKHLALILGALLLSACSIAPLAPPPDDLFADHLFQAADDQIPTEAIFALTPAMKDYAASVSRTMRRSEAQQALFDALYKRDQLQLDYDSAVTRTAAQAFESRMGNCLSLVIMTAALAREMGMEVKFQNVISGTTWSRSGDIYFNSGHVNVVLGSHRSLSDQGFGYYRSRVVDFMPVPDSYRKIEEIIDEGTVLAMFMNNRAAEALAQGKLDNAYRWARRSIETRGDLLQAYNTLAVIYQRHGNLPQAEHVLRFAMARSPENVAVMQNLVNLLDQRGQTAEAAMYRQKLASIDPEPAFHYFRLGQKAMEEGNYRKAREMFARELDREPDYHEFHFWYALASWQLGDYRAANEHMKQAEASSTTRKDHELYAGKLDRLRSLQAQSNKAPRTAN